MKIILSENIIKKTSLFFILEKSIMVGDNIIKKLNKINTPLSKKIISFLTSDYIKDDANVEKVEYNKKDGQLFTIEYTDRNGNVKERKIKIKKLLSYLGGNLDNVKDYEIEEIILNLKDSSEEQEYIKIVDGEELRKAFHCDSYDGETGSCMRYDSSQKYFDILVDNPEQVKMAIYYNPENNKIRARALLFFQDNGEVFMEKIYSTSNEYKTPLINFADSKGYITEPTDIVTLENDGEYDYYPYMDTFTYYSPDDGVLSHTDGEIYMDDTSGQPQNSRVYSEYHGEHIELDSAIYVDSVNSYVSDYDVVYDEYNDEYILQDDGIYVTKGGYEGKTVHKTDAVEDYDGDIIVSDESIIIEKGHYKGDYALVDEIVEDYENNNILRDEAIEIDEGEHSGHYAHEDEVVEDWDGSYILKVEARMIVGGNYDGEYIHKDVNTEMETREYTHEKIEIEDIHSIFL